MRKTNPTITKYKKQIEQLASRLETATYELNDTSDLLRTSRAKLERYEKQETEQRNQAAIQQRGLEDQVSWLRTLVEDLTIQPDTIKAVTTRTLRIQEQERRNRRLEMKDMERRQRESRRINELLPKSAKPMSADGQNYLPIYPAGRPHPVEKCGCSKCMEAKR